MRLQVGSIDRQLVSLAGLGSQRPEDAVEHAYAAPADEAVVDRLVRPVLRRRITPPQPVPGHEMMPLMMRRSSTLGTPSDKGK